MSRDIKNVLNTLYSFQLNLFSRKDAKMQSTIGYLKCTGHRFVPPGFTLSMLVLAQRPALGWKLLRGLPFAEPYPHSATLGLPGHSTWLSNSSAFVGPKIPDPLSFNSMVLYSYFVIPFSPSKANMLLYVFPSTTSI